MTTTAIKKTSTTQLPNDEIVFVGIDIGNREHVAAACPFEKFNNAVYKDYWKKIQTCHFSSDFSGFKKLAEYLLKFSIDPNNFKIILEPTGGNYGQPLVMWLRNNGFSVMQVENIVVKDYREKIFGSSTKTDDVDARLMARMGFLSFSVGEEFSIKPIYISDTRDSVLRGAMLDYKSIKKNINRTINQLQQIVAVTHPELKFFFKGGTSCITCRNLLLKYPTPHEIAQAGVESIKNVFLESHDYRHLNQVDELITKSKDSTGLILSGPLHRRQSFVIEQLNNFEKAKERLISEMILITEDHPYTPIINSLPVHSPIWTATIISCVGDISRFPDEYKFKAYCGWSPKTSQSGTSVHSTSLSHEGVRHLRDALGMMVLLSLSPSSKENVFRVLYARYVKKGMKKRKAIGKIAGKLAILIYSMLSNMQEYDLEKHMKSLRIKTLSLSDDNDSEELVSEAELQCFEGEIDDNDDLNEYLEDEN